MGFGATPHINSVFFLLAFSFALAVSKEKAVCGLDFVTNQVAFLWSLFEKSSAKTFKMEDFAHIVGSTAMLALTR